MMRLNVSTKNIKIIIFSTIIFFAEILQNGNLNLLYFFSLLLIPKLIINRSFRKDLTNYFFPFFFLVFLPSVLFHSNIQLIRAIIYCLKIFLCITIMSFVENNAYKYNFKYSIKVFAILSSLFLLLSLVLLGKPPLWRINDFINGISPVRLKLLFSEPSVLGLLCSILLLFVEYSFVKRGFKKETLYFFIAFIIPLILSFSVSAYIYTVISFAFILLYCNHKGKTSKRTVIFIILILVVCLLAIYTNNPISARLEAILNGSDGSFNFRGSLSFRTLGYILYHTKYLGLGLSNMNTRYGLKVLYDATGMDYKFPNSFMYFIGENGVFGITYLIIIFVQMIRNVAKEEVKDVSDFKYALLLLIFISQLVGGYFTDPYLWICYGIILSKKINKGDVLLV